MSSGVRFESTRRRLNDQQADTVGRLVAAAVEVLREKGAGGLAVRSVAARAGVAPATAYTYFSSKNHLIAEVFWRRLVNSAQDSPEPAAPSGDPVADAVGVLREVALLLADEPELSTAVTGALLGDDAEVAQLRVRIGLEIRRRLADALGETEPGVLEALEMVYAGALVRAGMGYDTYASIADSIERTARLILE